MLLPSVVCLQGTLSTAGLPEVTAAHTQLNAYAAALQEELAARQAAVTALTAEAASQASGVGAAVTHSSSRCMCASTCTAKKLWQQACM